MENRGFTCSLTLLLKQYFKLKLKDRKQEHGNLNIRRRWAKKTWKNNIEGEKSEKKNKKY